MPIGYSPGETGVSQVEEQTTYFSTERPVTIPAGQWTDLHLGFKAAVVNVRAEEAIDIAFVDPGEADDIIIPLPASDLPFSIGGARAISADTVYLIPQGDVSVDVKVIAYR